MVLDVKVMFPPVLERLKVSRVVLISGLLTFLYIIEFCIGVRTVYYAFSLWNAENVSLKTQKVSWTICVACLLVCVASSFAVNIVSALWEQKQIKEDGKVKRVTRFAFHIVVGGMIWRYVCLWFSDTDKSQRKESMLLTLAKFLFTQFYTIPLIIVHASLIENLDEIIYIVSSVSCISVNLILTCTMFSLCENEVNELKKWNYETLDLVPLIFCQKHSEQKTSKETARHDETSEQGKENEQSVSSECKEKAIETFLIKNMILFQTFGFTFGRLLALGILLKLAGIYAVSIMFLQLLISVVYLKFQVPFLVSDSLPKWRQLSRLAFMSYILIFEWHLNRDPKTGYDFTSNIKHSLLYYTIATVESVFYFIAWAIAYSYTYDDLFDDIAKPGYKLVKSIIIIGTMSLLFSLIVYFFIAFWQSRRLSSLMHSVRRHYLSSKLKMTNSILRKGNDRKCEGLNRSKLDISNPIPLGDDKVDSDPEESDNLSEKKHSSYKDLREPVDDEIEIYVGRRRSVCEVKMVSGTTKEENEGNLTINEEYHVRSSYNSISIEKTEGKPNTRNSHEIEQEVLNSAQEVNTEAVVNMESTIDKDTIDFKDQSKSLNDNDAGVSTLKSVDYASSKISEPSDDSQTKSKITVISESLGEGWNKFSALSKRFTGTMRDQFQKRKEQFHGGSTVPDKQIDTGQTSGNKHSNRVSIKSSASNISVDSVAETMYSVSEDIEEGYFVGDVRCYDQDVYPSENEMDNHDINGEEGGKTSPENTSTVEIHDEPKESESIHCIGDEPCPCFVCKPDAEGRFLRRRRSSSVPPAERKSWLESEMLSNEKTSLSAPSSPTSVRSDISPKKCVRKAIDEETTVPVPTLVFSNLVFPNLSLLPPEDRIEHYV